MISIVGYGLNMNDLSSIRKAVDALINDLLALGCEVVAVGRGYCITAPDGREATVKALLDSFGPRDDLLDLFNEILRLRGLVIEI